MQNHVHLGAFSENPRKQLDAKELIRLTKIHSKILKLRQFEKL